MDNKHLDVEEIIKLLKSKISNKPEFNALVVLRGKNAVSSVDMRSRSSMATYAQLVKGGVRA
jgi:dTDP-4-dehydrorhamnose 3,5-epimerase-like enzyme